MRRICCVIDLDGFTISLSKNGITYKPVFFLRELGFVKIRGYSIFEPSSYRFNLRGHLNTDELSQENSKTLEHQVNKIIGLPVYASSEESLVLGYEERYEVIQFIYEICQEGDRNIVAFKGGTREKEYLSKLKIPCINLEKIGCPKYEKLLQDNGQPVQQCGHHTLANRDVRIVHCSQAEVTAYRDWFLSNYKEFTEEGTWGPSENFLED